MENERNSTMTEAAWEPRRSTEKRKFDSEYAVVAAVV